MRKRACGLAGLRACGGAAGRAAGGRARGLAGGMVLVSDILCNSCGVWWLLSGRLVGFLWVSCGPHSFQGLKKMSYSFPMPSENYSFRIPSETKPNSPTTGHQQHRKTSARNPQETTGHQQDHAINAHGTVRNDNTARLPQHVSPKTPARQATQTPSHSFHLLNPTTPALSLRTMVCMSQSGCVQDVGGDY